MIGVNIINQMAQSAKAQELDQGKLNIVPGRISTVGPAENLGCFCNQRDIFSILINKLDFYGTSCSLSLPI